MGLKKVIYGNNVLLDLTNDTVTEEHLEAGYTAHNSDGESITGTMTSGGGTVKVSTLTLSPIAQRCNKIACIPYIENGKTFIIGGINNGLLTLGGFTLSKFIISPIQQSTQKLTGIAYAEINNDFGGKTLILGGSNGI